ncbi:MAG: lysophospholipid transporter LplT [Zetaproteobacteria bacterium CG02_land_8_20_14_3_00_50_9]|nr:MAG: lysophospholipid transporter LplT [Zetaproteobacteria bacterium CG17_big_fil_post_rev_8_21_14_2_50_50_13]PIV29526.1 MAG: lysophospholipid transporter LplT [Zetaproteobacteria bacterium CG02_land_8_20_14_3_00_50_9]PIY55731.1 MAG: lysophospholipid transporter LplT [Zetaproteobacteria bacterium CG_4_10_14_0_8_um_filter_49_80]
MSADVKKLLVAQFLTALADNAILFTAVAMVLSGALDGDWYVPALQGCFLVAFVVFAPWVGSFSDTRSKPYVLIVANLVKAAGAGLMLLGSDPLLAYTVIGLGAAAYSPAKYGILPELVHGDDLVRANGWIEGSTIIAILLGTVLGAAVADYSITLAVSCVLLIYLISAAVAQLMTKLPALRESVSGGALSNFSHTIRELLATPRARFSTLGVSLFWASAIVMRLVIIAWAPAVLLLSTSTQISMLTLFIALGIAVGAALAPRLIPLGGLRRARIAAYAMGFCILLLMLVQDVWLARASLFAAGICGGLFVVPVNAALQDIGHKSVGSGRAVAVQQFFENAAMLLATGLYTWSAATGAGAVESLLVLGVFVMLATLVISWHLPRDPQKETA